MMNAAGLELTSGDANLFRDFNSALASFNAAVKLSRSRKKAKELDAEEAVDTTVEF